MTVLSCKSGVFEFIFCKGKLNARAHPLHVLPPIGAFVHGRTVLLFVGLRFDFCLLSVVGCHLFYAHRIFFVSSLISFFPFLFFPLCIIHT